MLCTVLGPLGVDPCQEPLPLLHPLVVQFLPGGVQLEREISRCLCLFLKLSIEDVGAVTAELQLLQEVALLFLEIGSEGSHQSPFVGKLLLELR